MSDLRWITSFDDVSKNDARRLLGGKGKHLVLLQSWGLNVPRFGVVTTEAYREWTQTGALDSQLLDRILDEINSWPQLGASDQFFAVRSSMTAEDGEASSFAGVMDTFLYVTRDKIAEKIVECFKSASSERALDYQKRRVGAVEQSAAVIVQCMVRSEVSGVAFSRAPMGNSALAYVEAGYGLGEGVVAGKVEVDGFWWDRFGSEVKRRVVRKENQISYVASEKATVLGPVPASLSNKPTLSESALRELVSKLYSIESHLGCAADVEWAVASNTLYILQVRPITQTFPKLRYYADTNLCESYPGLTSPLTADFVIRMYTQVFIESGVLFGATKKRLELLIPYYKTLLSYFEGHLYYHLNSYYAILSALPGGSKNLDAWHRMIGGSKAAVELPKFPPLSFFEKLRVAYVGVKMLLTHQRLIAGFQARSTARLNKLDEQLAKTKTANETAQLLLEVIQGTEGFGLTAVNDVFVMSGTKALTSLLERNGIDARQILGLLKTKAGVDSMAPLKELRRLCAKFKSNPSSLTVDDPDVQLFLEKFGDRAFEELKLECMTFKQSPSAFLQLMQWMISCDINEREEPASQTAPSTEALRGLSAPQRFLLNKVAKFTEGAIRAREQTRLTRGRFFGWVRRAILKAFEQLKAERAELFGNFSTNAVFGLNLSVLEEFACGRISAETLAAEMEKNAAWSEVSIVYPEFFCHPETDEKPYFLESGLTDDQTAGVAELNYDGKIEALGAAPGFVRGKALLLTKPGDAMKHTDLKNSILVTQSTDPAWIFIMSQCAGLVSEKGSLLSHTAIIGRELGIPTVVGASNALKLLKQGELIEINGDNGLITSVGAV